MIDSLNDATRERDLVLLTFGEDVEAGPVSVTLVLSRSGSVFIHGNAYPWARNGTSPLIFTSRATQPGSHFVYSDGAIEERAGCRFPLRSDPGGA